MSETTEIIVAFGLITAAVGLCLVAVAIARRGRRGTGWIVRRLRAIAARLDPVQVVIEPLSGETICPSCKSDKRDAFYFVPPDWTDCRHRWHGDHAATHCPSCGSNERSKSYYSDVFKDYCSYGWHGKITKLTSPRRERIEECKARTVQIEGEDSMVEDAVTREVAQLRADLWAAVAVLLENQK